MIVIFHSGGGVGSAGELCLCAYLSLFGPIYGFGFTFANWRLVAEKTKRGANEGGAVLGIGIILSCLTENVKWGFWGWIILCSAYPGILECAGFPAYGMEFRRSVWRKRSLIRVTRCVRKRRFRPVLPLLRR